MPKNTLTSLLVATGLGSLIGFASLFLTVILLGGFYQKEFDVFISSEDLAIAVSFILCLLGPIIFSLGFLLPLAAIQGQKIAQHNRRELLVRFLPLVTLPVGVLLTLVAFDPFSDVNSKYSLFTVLLVLYSACCSSLFFFIRKIKPE